MKAIILAGGESTRPFPLPRAMPRPLLPFLNRPFLQQQIRCLSRLNVRDLAVAVSAQDLAAVSAAVGDGPSLGVNLIWRGDTLPRGPAGCLRLFEDFVGREPFLVVNGQFYPGEAELAGLLAAHQEKGAIATMAMCRDPLRPVDLDTVRLSADGQVEAVRPVHATRARASWPRLAGVAVFDPQVFEFIPQEGFVDVKEQVLTWLRQAGRRVCAHDLGGFHAQIDSPESYWRVQQQVLARGLGQADGTPVGEDVWVGRGAEVAASAYVLGPVLLGEDAVIEEQAQVIGPAVIGPRVRVGRAALVRESVLWADAQVGSQARVEYSVLGSGLSVSAERRCRHAVLLNGGPAIPLEADRARPLPASPTAVPLGPSAGGVIPRAIKRGIDLVCSTIGLIALAPILAVIAVAIRWDSPGPVFFIQRRCGRGGREFRMYKFRTMAANAASLQKELLARKSVDGPMFKIFDDPRLTRVGAFLRRNSLDELPQLVNVLKGDMSLVGPRPLIMDEMRFSPSWRDIRLSVKPGITGIWQVNGRSRTSFHDWIRHDVAYVKGWSLWLDLKILAKTAVWVMARTGAC